MEIPVLDKIAELAEIFPVPLYLVGGYVRDYLIGGELSKDVDLAAPCKTQTAETYIRAVGLQILAEYERTGTIVFTDGNIKYEYTSFREDAYVGGGHLPEYTTFTSDIKKDALRRDFKCNAVYYDVKRQVLVDPLGGVKDIENKLLTTVSEPKTVFSHDGLRLMRLARFAGELGFNVGEREIAGAKDNAFNVRSVSAERIFAELKAILVANKKHAFSGKDGHYVALSVLDKTRVLDEILPELSLGRGMEQRKDYHKYDVLEHSLKAAYYAPESVRLYALLHDVGKPYQMIKTGRYHGHDVLGAKLVKKIAARLKFDRKTASEAEFITLYHMADIDAKTKESKVRAFIVENFGYFNDLLLVKQADFSASKDVTEVSPTVAKWQRVYSNMVNEGVPFSVKELSVSAADLIELGFNKSRLSEELKTLLKRVVKGSVKNVRQDLLRCAERDI